MKYKRFGRRECWGARRGRFGRRWCSGARHGRFGRCWWSGVGRECRGGGLGFAPAAHVDADEREGAESETEEEAAWAARS